MRKGRPIAQVAPNLEWWEAKAEERCHLCGDMGYFNLCAQCGKADTAQVMRDFIRRSNVTLG